MAFETECLPTPVWVFSIFHGQITKLLLSVLKELIHFVELELEVEQKDCVHAVAFTQCFKVHDSVHTAVFVVVKVRECVCAAHTCVWACVHFAVCLCPFI